MVVFPIVIIISLILYVYYKVAILKSNDTLNQLYMNAKGKISLGVFIGFFGINQYLYYQTQLALYIGIVFLILGAMQFLDGFKRAKHYRKEQKKLDTKSVSER
ncbi:YtpI family protein [Sediminibacillus albus]|uniref:YtpI-like protein n=1 Tax=Sediminibacillus albus TaxID=407036 RepID=A0A1G9BVD9_9BACI|nr:YtpI family protein [Sediminibacillus albus]SDK43124.1 YtpI-like protein [Sediminibacillus albus]